MKKVALWIVSVSMVVLTAFVVNLLWFKPLSFNLFAEREFIKFGLDNPETMSHMGILDGTPFDFYNDKLTDVSMAARKKSLVQFKRAQEKLHEYDRDSLTQDEQFSYDVFDWYLTINLEGGKYLEQDYAITQMSGAYVYLVDFMSRVHRVNDKDDAEDYLARLAAVPVKMDQELSVARLQAEASVLPPRFVIQKVLTTLQNIRRVAPGESNYFTSYSEKLEQLDNLTQEEKDSFRDRALKLVEASVYPGYDRHIDWFKSAYEQSDNQAGIWKLPQGDEYYRYKIRQQTTTDMTAEEIHQLGLSEVARIEAEISAILSELGYTTGTPAENLIRLAADPRFLPPNTDESKQQIVSEYTQIISDIEAGVAQAFNLKPRSKLEVQRIPTYKEATSSTHYSFPSMDGSQPGVFFINLQYPLPRWKMRTLAYHEGIPGHHFQIGIANEMEDVPMLRRLIGFNAYAEGWALYAEQLAWEMGYHDDPYDNLGRLEAELFRSARLVVDTGIHHKRWTREQAMDYYQEHLGRQDVLEIERYIVWPAQALSYKIGMLKILQLREQARTELGDRFNLSDFHDVVIGNGSMPLQLLERQVNQYITRTKR